MRYSPHASKENGPTPIILSDDEVRRQFSRYKLSEQLSFVPEKLEIRERNPGTEEEDSRRVLLLAKDRLHYRVLKFAIPDALSSGTGDEDISMT